MTPVRPVRVFGDCAIVLEADSVHEAHGLAAAFNDSHQPGVEDVIVGFRSVTVVTDPTVTDVAVLGEAAARVAALAPGLSSNKLIEIPVAFDGSDLDDVAHLARLSPSRVEGLLTGHDLRVAFVGFAPGFAYLVGLPPELAAVPRRPTPRPAVVAGAVALAGGFAGIYPQPSPGGWHVVGQTGVQLFDSDAPPYSVLRAGDLVRLRAGEAPTGSPFGIPTGPRHSLRTDADRRLTVEDPGLLSFVQDRGRVGFAGIGVPRAGAADPYSPRIANRLVGNDEHAPGIEATARGPALRFSAPAHVAVVGTPDVTIDGRRVPSDTVVPVGADQVLTVGVAFQGLRAYIAVSGGIDIPRVLGSSASDVLSGLGAGPLVLGDVLGLGPAQRPRGRGKHVEESAAAGPIRVIAGPDEFPQPPWTACCRRPGKCLRRATGSVSAWALRCPWMLPVRKSPRGAW